jgi:hypothetical protein
MPSTGGGPPAPPAGLANYSIPHLLELYKKNQLNDEQMIQVCAFLLFAPLAASSLWPRSR